MRRPLLLPPPLPQEPLNEALKRPQSSPRAARAAVESRSRPAPDFAGFLNLPNRDTSGLPHYSRVESDECGRSGLPRALSILTYPGSGRAWRADDKCQCARSRICYFHDGHIAKKVKAKRNKSLDARTPFLNTFTNIRQNQSFSSAEIGITQ